MKPEVAEMPTKTEHQDIFERIKALEDRADLVEIILKSGTQEEQQRQKTKEVIQINVKGKKYFCINSQEQQIFSENNPGAKIETYTIELPVFIADKYLNDPENKKQFIAKKRE